MKSSHYGLNKLGYTRFTKVNTKSYKKEILSIPLKIAIVRINPWNLGL